MNVSGAHLVPITSPHLGNLSYYLYGYYNKSESIIMINDRIQEMVLQRAQLNKVSFQTNKCLKIFEIHYILYV